METVVRPERGVVQRWRLALWKYTAVLRVSIANNLAYMMEVFFRSLLLVVMVFILSQLWKTTFALHKEKVLSGFSINSMVWYLIAAESIALSMPALTRRIDQEVRSGQLAYLLGRPCSYVWYNFAQYLGERLIRWSMNCLIGAALALLVAGWPPFTWQGLLAWPLVSFLAISIEFVAYFCIGLLAFWIEETQSFSFVFSRLTLVLGGVLAPLEIFPQPLRSIALALPFGAILCKVYKSPHPLKLIAMIIGSLLLLVGVFVATLYLTGGFLVVTVFFPLFVIFYAVRTLLKGNLHLYVYTNGLLWKRGRRYEAARWDQIESIMRRRGQSQYGSALTCTIRLTDGRTLKINDALKPIEQLAMIIQNEFRRVRLPQAIATFERGEPVTFGKIQIDHQGLSNGKELIPWDQVNNMAIKQGLVVAEKNGRPIKWSKVKESETPNLYVLGSLVDYIVQKK